jgi:endonuclease-3
MRKSPQQRERANHIRALLASSYPELASFLQSRNHVQLLVATILSAQCTDARVNKITPALFARYPDAEAFASADQQELEKYVKATGFFRTKARNIIACCKKLVEDYQGEVPNDQETLVRLPGIGRKTANVILGNAYGVPGITVDTHVGRLSRRMGLTKHTKPEKVEQDLMELIPQEEWTIFSRRMIFHGRVICRSRRPRCETCPLTHVCPKLLPRKKARKGRRKQLPG